MPMCFNTLANVYDTQHVELALNTTLISIQFHLKIHSLYDQNKPLEHAKMIIYLKIYYINCYIHQCLTRGTG